MISALGKSLPFKPPSHAAKLIIFIFLSILVMVIDHRGTHLQQIRSGLSVLVYPIRQAAALPSRFIDWTSGLVEDDEALREEYDKMRKGHSLLLAKLQKYEALDAENRRLRGLLKSAARVADRAIVAELLEAHPEPFTRKIIINKGSKENVYIGQPVIDNFGIMGQVTEIGIFTSVVTLITDTSHAVPVQVNRNGLRTIVIGTGNESSVSVPYLTASAEIQKGDLLVTSGMGGGFPPGYPVAEVTQVIHDPNDAFLQISAKPKARLNHNKELLLIWPGKIEEQKVEDKP